ncbi:HAMP domain-containing sensor histidine kinase [Bengtsoniella intestinalis]|uniref:sensor histidine kinase n=1 Tax=Bengtsoniella intestinalis TaxID=3073143 RepID=UPI00391F6B9A
MTTIKRKISRPYLAIIVAIPVTIILLFNLLVYYYSQRQAEEDLLAAVDSVYAGIQDDDLLGMVSILKNYENSSSTEVIVYNGLGELSPIFNQYSSFVNDEIASLAYGAISGLAEGEIGYFNYDGHKFYAVAVAYIDEDTEDTIEQTPSNDRTPIVANKPQIGTGILAERKNQTTETTPQVETVVDDATPPTEFNTYTGNTLVYVSKGMVIDEFVSAINFLLLLISGIITLIAIFISTRISRSIAKPIERLTAMVENMKADEIVAIVEENDCVELQKLSTEINALSRRLYHFDQSQKKFLHNASHELRTPLMSIQGYADGIEMGVFEDAKGTAHLISDQSKRLTRLVDGLLTLARTENFNANKQLEKISLSNGLLDLLSGYTGYAMSQNIEIHHHIAPDIMVMGNQELLTSSVGNIISNGIRYATSAVSLSLKAEGKRAIITVRDDGKGIENIDHIFERFSKGEKGNFGLGLSIAKTSVEMMNGQIKAYNDQGAVFEIALDLL